MKKFLDINEQKRKDIFGQTGNLAGLPVSAVEKDWWVTLVLKAIFTIPFSGHIVFKGGTSLSKGWNLIERFSEDIDLTIDRSFLGFAGDLSKTQVRKLRKESCKFIRTDFLKDLDDTLLKIGITGYKLIAPEVKESDTDPFVLELPYRSVTEESSYLLPRVLIEIGARSLMEPCGDRPVQSMVGQYFKGQDFADPPVMIPVVLPKRTFLEKAFLMHEEFQKPGEKMRVERMSRHMYDLERLMDTEHGRDALKDPELYQAIIKHRELTKPTLFAKGIFANTKKQNKPARRQGDLCFVDRLVWISTMTKKVQNDRSGG